MLPGMPLRQTGKIQGKKYGTDERRRGDRGDTHIILRQKVKVESRSVQ